MFLLSIIVVSVGGVIVALTVPGWSDLLLLAGPCAIASVIARLRDGFGRAHDAGDDQHRLVLDGSNILHWKDGTPQIETLREVVNHIAELGYTPGVVFDANAGYLIADKYLHDSGFSKALGLPEENIMVVPKGSPADPTILDAARDLGAQVVSNDRFRDWVKTYPEVENPGFLIQGGYQSGHLWLGQKEEAAA